MKFTTLDENQHLNQPIHLCLATLFSRASSAGPFLGQATPTLMAGPEGLRAQVMGQSLVLLGWVLPGSLGIPQAERLYPEATHLPGVSWDS